MKRWRKSCVSCLLVLALLLCLLPVQAGAASSAQTILNQATLSPDHFLAEGSNDYYPELFEGQYSQWSIGVSFLPEDADALIVSTIQAQTNSSMSTYEKVMALYTYIIETTDYGYGGHGNYCSVYSVLELHIGTCYDYNYVMMAFLRYLGIDAALVYGQTHKASGGYTSHKWVEAYIGGVTYVFDPQIDDNIANGGTIYYYRFCKTYAEVEDKYILEDDVYTLYYASPYFEYVCYDYFEGASTLRQLGLTDLDAADKFGFAIEGAVLSGWYYDEACTQPVSLDAAIKKNTIIWAQFSVAPFTDVPVSAYYAAPVAWAYSQGITAGTGPTAFSPSQGCTRAQFVTFLYALASATGADTSVTASDTAFTDVSSGDWYENAVLWAAEHGITAGTTATTFTPDRTITRREAIAMLYAYEKMANGAPDITVSNPFSDVSDGDWARSAILWAYEQGITAGTSATTFSPGQTCTRAMMVTYLYQYAA